MKELEILKRNIKIAQDFATYLCLNYPANIHRFNIIQFELVFLFDSSFNFFTYYVILKYINIL